MNRSRVLFVLAVVLSAAVVQLAGASSGPASAGKFSARLTKTSFTSAQASKVKLIYKFSKASKSFSYLLTRKNGKKWAAVKSARKTGFFKTYKITVKKLFAGKAVKRGV
jgi:ABC-type oligopeptide transport system substrate-binding subunit